MREHLLDPATVEQPGSDMGGEEEAEEMKALVKPLPLALNGLGEKLTVDGIMGPKTKAAMVKIATN